MRVTRYFFNINVENKDIFDFSRCRHFLDHVITPRIGNFPIKLIWAFLAQFLALFAPFIVFLTCFIMENEENIGILLNFIDNVIVTSSPRIFKGFSFCCCSFLKFSFENLLHLLLRKKWWFSSLWRHREVIHVITVAIVTSSNTNFSQNSAFSLI